MVVPLFNLAPDLTVSRLCLGTMTFGKQNSFSESVRILDNAFNSGINFFDSAEMYPVPQHAESHGKSEVFLGRWVKERKISRSQIIVSTKVSGPSGQMTWIRGGPSCLDSVNITSAIDSSLQRLQMDYIDLYQIHWPDRYVPIFGETDYDPTRQYDSVDVEEQLEALGKAVTAGKIRFIGLSNETPYGVMKFLHASQRDARFSKIISLQNAYNLLCRNFDSGLAECCHLEKCVSSYRKGYTFMNLFWNSNFARVSLLAYSPLAMGILSGKYYTNGGPVDARLNLFKGRYSEGESRYRIGNSNVKAATLEYAAVARKYGLNPVSLAIGFVLNHPLVASTIFGATKLWQLNEVVNSCEIKLSERLLAEINDVYRKFPNPCP